MEAKPDAAAAPDAPPADPSIPKSVRWIGVASLMTDASGEMIYPLIPFFLTSVLGGSVAFVGIIEGFAESVASLIKLFSGRISDRVARRKPLVVFGYGVTAVFRPMVALATSPWMVLFFRFADRVGKGIRGSPREAMITDATPKAIRGKAFGYHAAMDHVGAVIGPLMGFVLMVIWKLPLRSIFAWAAVPGVLAVFAVLMAKEAPKSAPKAKPPIDLTGYGPLYKYLTVLGVFTLGNASDAFLLLRSAQILHPGQQLGSVILADPTLLLLWAFHNFIKAVLGEKAGELSDKWGRKKIIGAGFVAYAITYLCFGFANAAWQVWVLFAVYGLYYSLIEGAEKALIADLTPEHKRGAGFGWYNAVIGILSLPASALFGFLYKVYGGTTAFEVAAGLAALSWILLVVLVKEPEAAAA
jgi:MFS family permease